MTLFIYLGQKSVMLNSYNLFVTVRCWNTLLEMFHIICASCGESCDQFQLSLAGRNVSMHDCLGHFGWFWGAFHGFWVCCHRIGLSLFCECIFVDGTASERTGVYSADLMHLYADYGCDAVAIFGLWNQWFDCLWPETSSWDLYAQKVKNVLNYLKVKLQRWLVLNSQ